MSTIYVAKDSTHGMQVEGTATTITPFSVKGVGSQSADFFQVLDSSGTTVLGMSPTSVSLSLNGGNLVMNSINGGALTLPSGNYTIQAAGSARWKQVNPTITTNTAAGIPLQVVGVSSQSGNLQEWQDSSAVVLAKISSGGAISTHAGSSLDYTTTTAGLYLGYQGSVAPTILFANGTAAQNIRIDQVSGQLRATIAGTNLFTLDASTCLFTTSNLKSTNNIQALGNLSAQKLASATYNALQSTAQLYLDGFNGGAYGGTATANGYGIWDTVRMTDDGGTPRTAHSNEYYVATAAAASWKARVVNKVGDLTAQREYLRAESDGTYGLTSIGGAVVTASTALTVTSPTATYIPLIAKGASSQSANLQEWQDSAGTVKSSITKDGYFANGSTQIQMFSSGLIQIDAAQNVCIGAEAGGSSLRISSRICWSTDALNTTGDVAIDRSAAGILVLTNNSSGNGSLICGAYSASTIGLTVKGAASQSASLQEWQNSSGTVLSRVDKNGTIVTKVNSAPADGDLAANECSMWFDSTNLAAKVMFKGKSADGTVVTGTVLLT